MKQEKKRIFSGIQPSGNLHIGNYLGAIIQWVDSQKDHDCIFCVVDYHAITVKQNPEELKKKIIEVAKIYLAAGIDPTKSIIFQQSDVSAHTELAWILNTVARMSDLYRMTQFKDKSNIQIDFEDNIKILKFIIENKRYIQEKIIEHDKKEGLVMSSNNSKERANELMLDDIKNSFETISIESNKAGVGLFDYPILMASDILLYNTDIVPVGKDQVQHIELTRELARRFNQNFGETFKIPEPKTLKEGACIMGLDDPTKKMSKSAKSEYNFIALTDDPEKAAKKIMRAETDSGSEVKYDVKNKPGISNLLVIYSLLANESIKNLENKYKGKGYGEFKQDLAEVVKQFLTEFQNKYNKISAEEVENVLADGAKKARPIAEETLKKVKKKMGIK